MSTTIRISEDTKRELEAQKRDDETWDEFLRRISRTEKDVEEMAGWGNEDEDMRDHVETKRDELTESLVEREADHR
jgi:predicted CopG family antitoxin